MGGGACGLCPKSGSRARLPGFILLLGFSGTLFVVSILRSWGGYGGGGLLWVHFKLGMALSGLCERRRVCGLCPKSTIRRVRALPSEVYPAVKLQRYFTCGFDFRLWLPFTSTFVVLKDLSKKTSMNASCFHGNHIKTFILSKHCAILLEPFIHS